MDVARAKSIVILLLIAFNVFLLANNLIHRDSQSVSKEVLENTETILEQRGVKLECDIPSTPGGASRLVYITGGLDRDSIAENLLGEEYEISADGYIFSHDGKRIVFEDQNRFTYTDDELLTSKGSISEKEAGEAALRFMKEKGLLGGKYVPDDAIKNSDGSWTFDYIETFSGSFLYDNSFSITISQNYVSRLIYHKQQIKGFSSESIERAQAYQALLSRFKDETDIIITSIDSGYKLDESAMEEMESVELLPVWRVKLKGISEPVYIGSHDS